MKAVLGMLFILVGVTVGWLVLSGKLPNPNPTPPTPSSNSPTNTSASTTSIGASNPYNSKGANQGIPLIGRPF